jgi:hypothetical protein
MAALTDALDYGYQAAIAIRVGRKDRARKWLDDGLEPSVRAFPSGSPEWFGLALVYGALIKEAAA